MVRVLEGDAGRLNAAISLVRLVEASGVRLVKRGAEQVGHCPFHEDEAASLVIAAADNAWRCTGACDTGGGVIDWMMKRSGVSRHHAIAEGLAQMARTGWFKAVRIKDEATHIERAHLKIREQLVASHRVMAGQLRGLLKLFGLRMGKASTPGKRRERLEALFVQKPELRGVMAPLIEGLEAIEVQIGRSSRRLAAQAAADPVSARLMSVPGVGPITALVFKTSIEDPARFERGEDAGAFAGLAPRRSQSGMRDHKGRISKAGDPMLRAALYEAANSLLSRVKRPCALRAWGERLAETKGPKRARVAVARKLAILLHRLWRSETEFRWA